MTYQGIIYLQASLDAIFASFGTFTTNSQDENLHLALRELHRTQVGYYTAMAINDNANQDKYERWIAIHKILRETHEVIHSQIHQRNTLVIQPRRGRDF